MQHEPASIYDCNGDGNVVDNHALRWQNGVAAVHRDGFSFTENPSGSVRVWGSSPHISTRVLNTEKGRIYLVRPFLIRSTVSLTGTGIWVE